LQDRCVWNAPSANNSIFTRQPPAKERDMPVNTAADRWSTWMGGFFEEEEDMILLSGIEGVRLAYLLDRATDLMLQYETILVLVVASLEHR